MKTISCCLALLTAFLHPVRTSAQSIDLGGHTTRAVVIGISDYQDEGIPDLRFADEALFTLTVLPIFKNWFGHNYLPKIMAILQRGYLGNIHRFRT